MTAVILYIDPGSSSMLIQMIVAGALGFIFFIKTGWYRIKSFFSRKKEEDTDVQSGKSDE